jgi:ParB-like chromosome segregation protein Spo0J
MSVIDQQYEVVSVEQLTEHPDNPHRGDTQLIGKSINRHGFYGAVIVQRSTGHVLAGNHRYRAAKEQGLAELPVIFLDVDDQLAKRIMLVDNRATEHGTWVYESLNEILSELRDAGDDLSSLGWNDAELTGLLADTDPIVEPENAESLRYAVVIECKSEAEQSELVGRLEAEGLDVQAWTR